MVLLARYMLKRQTEFICMWAGERREPVCVCVCQADVSLIQHPNERERRRSNKTATIQPDYNSNERIHCRLQRRNQRRKDASTQLIM